MTKSELIGDSHETCRCNNEIPKTEAKFPLLINVESTGGLALHVMLLNFFNMCWSRSRFQEMADSYHSSVLKERKLGGINLLVVYIK